MDSLRSWGNPNAPLMIVLEAPNPEDMRNGTLFSGWQGNMITKCISRSMPHLQVVCVLDQPKVGILAKDIGAAIDAFRAKIQSRSAVVVVPMGSIALQACMGDLYTSIMEWRGYVIDPATAVPLCIRCPVLTEYKSSRKPTAKHPGYTKGDPRTINKLVRVPGGLPQGVRHIIPTITPATVQKSGLALFETMHNDLRRALKFKSNPDSPLDLGDTLAFGTDLTKITEDIISIDIETWSGRIDTIGMADSQVTVSTPFIASDVGRVIRPGATIVAHNAAFEYEHLSGHMNLSDAKLWCTMLAAYMLQPDGRKSLNWVTSSYLDARRHKHLSQDQPEFYNATDARAGYLLYAKLRDGLSATGQLRFFEHGMMPAIPTLVNMHLRGIRVDQTYAQAWEAELTYELSGIPIPLWATSPLQLARKLGLKNSDEEQLLKLKIKDPSQGSLVDDVLRWRNLKKCLSTYVCRDTYSKHIYPSYLPGARDTDEGNKGIAYSGRPTASKPNIQNQPPEARRQFIADDGHTLASLDWSQIEPRIIAALSEDDNLAEDIEAGLYDSVASTLGCDRSTAKTVVLLSAYLGSPRTLQDKLMLNGVIKSFTECKQLQDRMFERYAKWKAWRQRVIDNAESNRRLCNPFGKSAPFTRVHPAKAVNFLPQSSAACILWYCLPQVEKAIAPYGGQILTTVHDEILVQGPPDRISMIAGSARGVMEQEWPQIASGFHVPVKIKFGTVWADMLEITSPWATYEL